MMLRASKILTALELKNLYGFNTLRHTKDKSVRRRGVLMGSVWVLLIVMIAGYVGGLVYGLHYLGAGEIAPMYIATICALIIFAFGIFKAGGVIFNLTGYDSLCALPVPAEAIVISRFARLYVEDLLMTLLVMLPGGAVYAFLSRPGLLFWLMWAASTALIPLLPLSAAAVIGTIVAALSSRMKRKSIAESFLAILLALGIMVGSSALGVASEEFTPEMLAGLADMLADMLKTIYPPAFWFGRAMAEGDVGSFLLAGVVSAAALGAVLLLAARMFHGTCRRLNVNSAKHDYRMERSLQSRSVLSALLRRELKRYFASGIYVTNTIMGPVMGVMASGVVLFGGVDALSSTLQMEFDMAAWMPLILGGIFAMMPTTAVSISMEGKSWWIAKSLPLPTKVILQSKILANLVLILPFFTLSEIMVILALRPRGLDLLWIIVVPAVLILFSCVYALAVNLMLPRLDWDSEVYVVKQSAAAGLGGLGGMLITVVCALVLIQLPAAFRTAGLTAMTILLLGGTVILYQMSIRKDLKDI